MNRKFSYKIFKVAFPVLGSAILLLSCGGNNSADDEQNLEKIVTHKTDTLTVYQSEDGKIKYRFEAPLMEVYEYAKQPYTEFREGLFITTYNDSTMAVESTLRADYGLVLDQQDLWEAKGNVVATNARGEKLETQQLFWNRRTNRIYSNVDSKVTMRNTVQVGTGFESDEEFKDWTFRQAVSTFEFEVDQKPKTDPESSGAETGVEIADDTTEVITSAGTPSDNQTPRRSTVTVERLQDEE